MSRRFDIQATDIEGDLRVEILEAGTAATIHFCNSIRFTPRVTDRNDMMPLWFGKDAVIKGTFVYLRFLAGNTTVTLGPDDYIHQIAPMIKSASTEYRRKYVDAWRHMDDSHVAHIRTESGLRYVCETRDDREARYLSIRASFDLEIRLQGEGEYFCVRDAELPVDYFFSISEPLPPIEAVVPPGLLPQLTAIRTALTGCTTPASLCFSLDTSRTSIATTLLSQ